MLGLTPILDFDGTITELPVDWSSLRRQLGIHQIVDLWERDILIMDLCHRSRGSRLQ